MIDYKLKYNKNIFYSDTDSIFTEKTLPDSIFTNTELGLMKNELIDKSINKKVNRAIFLGNKKYFY